MLRNSMTQKGMENRKTVALISERFILFILSPNSLESEKEPGREQVQALADISRSAVRCHSNETCAPILYLGPCSSVGMRRGTDRHTDGRDHYTFRLGYASREM